VIVSYRRAASIYGKNLTHSVGSKVRLSADSTWYVVVRRYMYTYTSVYVYVRNTFVICPHVVRHTSVYVCNTFCAYKERTLAASSHYNNQRQRCCIRSEKKWKNIRAVIVASRRQQQLVQYAGAVGIGLAAKYVKGDCLLTALTTYELMFVRRASAN